MSSLIESTCQEIELAVSESHGQSKPFVDIRLSTNITVSGYSQQDAQMKYYYYLFKALDEGGYKANLIVGDKGRKAYARIALRDDSAEMLRSMQSYVRSKTL
jgi:hypothetical protein